MYECELSFSFSVALCLSDNIIHPARLPGRVSHLWPEPGRIAGQTTDQVLPSGGGQVREPLTHAAAKGAKKTNFWICKKCLCSHLQWRWLKTWCNDSQSLCVPAGFCTRIKSTSGTCMSYQRETTPISPALAVPLAVSFVPSRPCHWWEIIPKNFYLLSVSLSL